MSAAPISIAPDREHIRRAINVLHAPDAVIELRALHKGGRKRVDAGYFDGEHRDQLIEEAVKLNAQGAAVYIQLNPLDPHLLGRYANRVEPYAQATATDANITRRHWLLVDLDPARPKDVSATADQLQLATKRARDVYTHLSEQGWPRGVVAESGNGMHLCYRIDLPNDDASRDLVKGCLEALSQRFDDYAVKIDKSVHNSARIIKLWGTISTKGDNIESAPWRLSRLKAVPQNIETVSLEQLQALAAEVTGPAPQQSNGHSSPGMRSWTETDVASFLLRCGIEATGPEPHNGSLRWKLRACPFNADHVNGEAAVFLKPDGVLGFRCLHNGCADKHWREFRDLVDPRETRRPNHSHTRQETSPQPSGGFGGSRDRLSESFSWPAPTPLPDGLPPVAVFDYELLPPVLHRLVQDIAERMQCPPDFPAVASVVMLASLVGRRCGIAPKRADDWIVVPNLWGAVIGRPGIMKSPPLAEVLGPLEALEARAAEQFEHEQAEHQAGAMVAEERARVAKDAIRKMLKEGNTTAAEELAQEAVGRDRTEPSCRRYKVNDTTVEKLGEILNENPYGVLLFRDELNGFFRALERQGHEADRAFYLESWNGDGSFTYDRIGRGTVRIGAACLSILGSIQPGPLGDIVRGLRGSGDDGLLQRFQLAVWPDSSAEWKNVDRAPDKEARAAMLSIIQRLQKLTPEDFAATGTIPCLRFSGEAQDLFDVWREALERRLRSDAEHPMLEAHLAKYRSLVPSLALILHLTESSAGPVERLALERAIAWAEYLESHAKRIYAPAINPDVDAARMLGQRIKRGDLGATFTLHDVYHNGWSGLATREAALAAVGVLEDYGWLRQIVEETNGRPRTVCHVNPAVLGQRQ